MQNEPDFNATLDLDALLERLKNLVLNSPNVVFDKAIIDEEEFFFCTAQIRKCAPRLFVNPNNQSYNLLSEIEKLAQTSKVHFFGKTMLDRETHKSLLAALSEAIEIERKVIEISGAQPQADEIIRIAQMQAQSIIEQAHQEAQRIIENAKRQK